MTVDPQPTLDSLSAGMRITPSNLTSTVSQLLAATGMDDQSAARAAELMVWAQRSGIDSHGVMHLPSYVRRLLNGTINLRPRLEFDNPEGASSALDADNALGCLAASTAMREAMDRADAHGVGAIAVRNSSHFGPAGVYVYHAASAGYVAMAFSNASPTMAPWSGREPVLGTNPVAAAFPRPDSEPIVIDLASTTGSRAMIRKAASNREPIPAGWALDSNGNPTVDASEALDGTMQPMGGAKGYALSLMVELLCSAFSGGVPGYEVRVPQDRAPHPCNVSHFFLAFSADAFGASEGLLQGVERVALAVEHSTPTDPEQPVRLPGSKGARHRALNDKHGISLTAPLLDALRDAERLIHRSDRCLPKGFLSHGAHGEGEG